MDESKDTAMIALLPTSSDWCKIDLPHMTVVFAGKITDRKITDFNEMAKDAAAIAMVTKLFSVEVLGVSTYGTTEQVDALKLKSTPQLLGLRRVVEKWNASEHSFNPHLTIGPVGSAILPPPKFITFDRILVAWGNEAINMWLTPC